MDCQQALSLVGAGVDRFSEELRSKRLANWRESIRTSFAKQCKWIRDRADLQVERCEAEPSLETIANRTVHPAIVLAEEHQKWTEQWTAPSHDC